MQCCFSWRIRETHLAVAIRAEHDSRCTITIFSIFVDLGIAYIISHVGSEDSRILESSSPDARSEGSSITQVSTDRTRRAAIISQRLKNAAGAEGGGGDGAVEG